MINDLIRPHLLALKPYTSARDEYSGTEGIFLDANENAYGSAGNENFNRYPDPYQHKLKTRIGEIKNCPPENIFLGNGSDEAIDLLFRAFVEPHRDNVIIMPPTYGMYQVSAEINCAVIRTVPLRPDFQIDTKEVLDNIDAQTKLIFICSPNNPTANSLKVDDIEHILKSTNALVVVDEAYIDFSAQLSFVAKLNEFSNLVILQTFSKAYGLAALRLGMAFAATEIIAVLNKIKPPYNINELTQRYVLAFLSPKEIAWKNDTVRRIIQEREKLSRALSLLACVEKVYPSDANFLLVKMPHARRIYDYLVARQIIVRDRSRVILCTDCLRITVGKKEENEALLAALTVQ